MSTLGEVFNPIIPAFIVSGIAMGCANIISQYGNIDGNGFLCVFYNFLVLINNSFTSLLPCWIGFYTVKMAGGSPILGGMLGVATGLSEINSIASYLNLNGILYPGAGGVLASFFGALILSKIEKSFKKVLPGSISLVLTPLFSLFLALIPYVFLIMPIAGLLSALICNILEFVSLSESLFQNIIVGFFFAAVFLPINVAGLQHGIIALYPILLERYGYITWRERDRSGQEYSYGFKQKRKGIRSFQIWRYLLQSPGFLGLQVLLSTGYHFLIQECF